MLSAVAITVTNNHDSGPGSLRQAIADVSDGGTITFARSVHNIMLTTGELAIAKNLTIQGPGDQKLDISGGDASRVFDVAAGNVNISGLTVSDGRAGKDAPVLPSAGGGILNQAGASLTLSDVNVVDSEAVGDKSVSAFLGTYLVPFNGYAVGGGLENFGTLSVSGGTFRNDQALGADGSVGANFTVAGYFNFPGLGLGGGINNHGTATVAGTQFIDNLAQAGSNSTGTFAGTGGAGAIYNDNTMQISGSLFSHNQAIGGDNNSGDVHTGHGIGGAIVSGSVTPFSLRSASLTIGQSLFDDNLAQGGDGNQTTVPAAYLGTIDLPSDGNGGALFVYQGSVGLEQSLFTHNLAQGGAGAAGQKGGDALGGGILLLNFIGGVQANIDQTVIDHNDALGGPGSGGGSGGNAYGGGIASGNFGGTFAAPGMVAVSQTLIAHNLAQGGTGTDGGNGLGGGLFNDLGSIMTLDESAVLQNRAQGGKGAPSGNDGQGVGGGIYDRSGTLVVSSTTVVAHNDASSSNDDIYP